MDIQWTENDEATGGRLYYKAERFGGMWKIRVRTHRRGESKRVHPTRAIWETILDNLERRYRRREGVDDDDLDQVKRILLELPNPPSPAEE